MLAAITSRKGNASGPTRDKTFSRFCLPTNVAVIVKRGLVRPGRVLVDHTTYRVRRNRDGSFVVPEAASQSPGRVNYLFLRDQLFLENPLYKVAVLFHTGETTFEFDRRTYSIGPLTDGRVLIREQDRTVVEGRVTPTGVRLDTIAAELEPIQNELAFGLALRTEDLDRQFNPHIRRTRWS